MWIGMIRVFNHHEVLESSNREDLETWYKKRMEQLKQSYPNGIFPLTLLRAEETIKVCGYT